MTHHAVLKLLEDAVYELKADLKIIEQQAIFNNQEFIVCHDNVDQLIVHAAPEHRAFIPKKYNGFQVSFIPWTGSVSSTKTLNMDEFIIFDVSVY